MEKIGIDVPWWWWPYGESPLDIPFKHSWTDERVVRVRQRNPSSCEFYRV